MVCSARNLGSFGTRFDNVCYHSNVLVKQLIYITKSLHSKIQSKHGDLKVGDKNRNFMQIVISVTVFLVLPNAQKFPTKIIFPECTLFVVYICSIWMNCDKK